MPVKECLIVSVSCCTTSSSLFLLCPGAKWEIFLRIRAMCGTQNHLHFIGGVSSSENSKSVLTSPCPHTRTSTRAYVGLTIVVRTLNDINHNHLK